MKQTQVERK